MDVICPPVIVSVIAKIRSAARADLPKILSPGLQCQSNMRLQFEGGREGGKDIYSVVSQIDVPDVFEGQTFKETKNFASWTE